MKRPNYADLMDLSVLHNEIRRRAGTAGLAVQFREGLKTAGTDGKNIYIPRLKQPITREEITRLRGQVIHEVGHVKRKRALDIGKEYNFQHGQPHAELMNIIEDESMEAETAAEFMGDAQSLGQAADMHYKAQMDDMLPILQKMKDAGQKCDDKTRDLTAAYMVASGTRHWDYFSRATRERFEEMMPDDVKTVIDALRKEGWDKKIAACQTPDDAWEVTKQLTKRLFPDEPEPTKGAGEGKGKGEGQPGDAAGEKIKGKAPGKEGEDGQDKDKIHWSQLKQSDHSETHKDGGGGVDWSSYRAKDIDPQFLRRDFRARPPAAAKPPTSSLAGRLRILVQSQGKAKMVYDKPSGKLNKRRLGILAMPLVAGATAHRRAFKKRIPGLKLNTVVHILVDVSGSMSGEKKLVAAQCADRLCTDLARGVRVPVAVTAFGGDSTVPLWKMKEYHEPAVPGVVAGLNNVCGGGNSDGDAVLYAGETLLARKEKRKILIVLSDGMPTGSASGTNPADMLKTAISTVMKRGIEVFGIGIQDTSVKMFYGKDCKVINSLEQFDQALLSTLADKLMPDG